MNILIYAGEGVAISSLKLISECFKGHSSPVIAVNAQFLKEKDWEEESTLIIFPGGRDIPYQSHLAGYSNQRIRAFIENGGSYLGICAGGYYGANQIEFEKGFPLEICAQRELNFFPGKAIGPAYGNGLFQYEDEQGARNAQLIWLEDQTEFNVYFNGGCFFHNAQAYPLIQTLAVYEDLPNQPAAIIECQVGKGKAILSGVHPEYPLLSPQYSDHQKLWRLLMKRLLTNVK